MKKQRLIQHMISLMLPLLPWPILASGAGESGNRQTLHDAVQFVLGAVYERLQSYAASVGKVIPREGSLVYINMGLNAQLQVGNRLPAFSV